MDSERIIQNRVIRFFRDKLQYAYIGNLRDTVNKNIKEERLKEYLRLKGYSKVVIDKAVRELVRTAGNMQHGIYAANKEVYNRLKYGVKIKEHADAAEKTVYFIDFEHPADNDFALAEEVTIAEKQEKRPDLVVYLNGIAVAVLELKKSSISVSTGIRQNLTNQKDSFIESFFATMQFCLAANEAEGLRYATLKTPEKYYMRWQSDHFTENNEERHPVDIRIEKRIENLNGEFRRDLYGEMYALFDKERFLDLMHNFVVFDKGAKKVCRYNQFYGVKRAASRIHKCENGIIWHTQGSGKTLTMIWLSKWILENLSRARVLIVTDREELDDQIEKTYNGVDEHIVRTKSGRDLITRLNLQEDRLICSLVHKFGKRGGDVTGADYDKYIEEIKKSLPSDFVAKGDIYVFVDECHRTQSGKLHKAMEAIMPRAVFIGFTGTPLLKEDKQTSIEVFGTYIHTYKFNEAVADGVVLDLRYEARDIPQDLSSQAKIDQWFEIKTRGLTPRAQARLKQRWGNMQKVYGSRSRLARIAWDIVQDFDMKPRLAEGSGNAILVADSISSACKYYEIFQSQYSFKKCAIISSYTPQAGDLRTDTVSDEDDTDTFLKYDTYLKMIGLDAQNLPEKGSIVKKIVAFEQEAKRKFQDEPVNMKLLIVVDKLLTGFDAPPCTYLYVDKAMHDHGLFQAVCRVNRLDGETKDFGYIVDYKHLFGDLKNALDSYTSDAFAGYDAKDVEGLLKERSEAAISYFKEVLDELAELTEGVEPPRGELEYQHYFCGESVLDEELDEAYARLRERLYRLAARLARAFSEAKPYFVDKLTSAEVAYYEKKVTDYLELKKMIGNSSGDTLDLKAYEPDMRKMMDNYIIASDAEKIGEFDDFTLLDFVSVQGETMKDSTAAKDKKKGAAEAIENNIRRKIVEKMTVNPKYYENMSAILKDLIELRNQDVKDYAELLKKYQELVRNVEHPEENAHYPESIKNSPARRALYDNLGRDEVLAIAIDEAVHESKISGFRGDEFKERRIKREIYKILHDADEVERTFKIVEKQEEYK